MKSRNKETAGVYLGWDVETEEDDAEDDDGENDNEDNDNEENEGGENHREGEGEGQAEAGEHAEAGVDDDSVATPRYVIELPAGFSVDPAGVLFFSLADANESSALPAHLREDEQEQEGEQDAQDPEGAHEPEQAHQGEQPEPGAQEHGEEQEPQQDPQQNEDNAEDDDDGEDEEEEDAPREPIDLTVRFVDADGAFADVPLSRFSMVQPQLEVQLRKAFLDEPRTESEAVFQSFIFPLGWFLEANPDIDTSRPARLELVFDRSESGVVILDTLGFRPFPGL